MTPREPKAYLLWFMVTLAVITATLYLLRPLYDPDFYWHLATGRWIWHHKMLPAVDPFGIPPFLQEPPSPRSQFMLSSYWLHQVVLYLCYTAGGMSGIVLFRWVIAGITAMIFARWAKLRNGWTVAVLATGMMLLLEYYFLERPQFVSFVCFAALCVIIFRFTEAPHEWPLRRLIAFLVPLMLIWANSHGGFLIGQALILFFCAAEGVKFLHPALAPLPWRAYRVLLIAAAITFLASLINPNAVNLIRYLPTIFDTSDFLSVNNLEYLSLVEYFRQGRDYTVIIYIASMAATLWALVSSRYRSNITWLGIIAVTAYMGSQHIRLMPFFLMAATLFVTRYFEVECNGWKGRLVLCTMLFFTTVYCASDEFPRVREATRSGWVPASHYPVRAADFVVVNSIPGNIFTQRFWGGYMIWRVGPEQKVFDDGRGINVQRGWEYLNCLRSSSGPNPYWKSLFRMYDIRVVILPVTEETGEPNPLVQSITADPSWTTAFVSDSEVVFVKQAETTAALPVNAQQIRQ